MSLGPGGDGIGSILNQPILTPGTETLLTVEPKVDCPSFILGISLKGTYYALFQSLHFGFGVYKNRFSCLKVKKKHFFSHILHHCNTSLPSPSVTICLSPNSMKPLLPKSTICSDWCVVIGQPLQACLGSVTTFSITVNFSRLLTQLNQASLLLIRHLGRELFKYI